MGPGQERLGPRVSSERRRPTGARKRLGAGPTDRGHGRPDQGLGGPVQGVCPRAPVAVPAPPAPPAVFPAPRDEEAPAAKVPQVHVGVRAIVAERRRRRTRAGPVGRGLGVGRRAA